MPPFSPPNGEESLDATGMTNVEEPVLPPLEGHLVQDVASLQSQLSAMSQRQDQLMQIVGALREQGGPASGPNDGRERTTLPGGSVPYEARGPPQNVLPNEYPVPGHPAAERIPPPQGQVQGQGQPAFHQLGQDGRPLVPPPSRQYPYPSIPGSIPIYGQLQNRAGQVIGLVHQGSFSVSRRAGAGPGIGQVPPPPVYPQMQPPVHPQIQPPVHPQMQPQVHPQMQPPVHPQMLPRMIPQMPPHLNLPAQSRVMVRIQGSMMTNWGPSVAPPPPYPGPVMPGGRTPSTSQAGTPTTPVFPQPGTMQMNPDDDSEDDSSDVDARHVPGRNRTGSGSTRTNPPRKARLGHLSESD